MLIGYVKTSPQIGTSPPKETGSPGPGVSKDPHRRIQPRPWAPGPAPGAGGVNRWRHLVCRDHDGPVIPDSWLPVYRPDDLELVGYLAPHPDEPGTWAPMSLLGTPVDDRPGTPPGSVPMTEYAAEQVLLGHGLSTLAERWLLRHDDGPLAGLEEPVTVVEVTPEQVVCTPADFALVAEHGRELQQVRLPVPTDRLRQPRPSSDT